MENSNKSSRNACLQNNLGTAGPINIHIKVTLRYPVTLINKTKTDFNLQEKKTNTIQTHKKYHKMEKM